MVKTVWRDAFRLLRPDPKREVSFLGALAETAMGELLSWPLAALSVGGAVLMPEAFPALLSIVVLADSRRGYLRLAHHEPGPRRFPWPLLAPAALLVLPAIAASVVARAPRQSLRHLLFSIRSWSTPTSSPFGSEFFWLTLFATLVLVGFLLPAAALGKPLLARDTWDQGTARLPVRL